MKNRVIGRTHASVRPKCACQLCFMSRWQRLPASNDHADAQGAPSSAPRTDRSRPVRGYAARDHARLRPPGTTVPGSYCWNDGT